MTLKYEMRHFEGIILIDGWISQHLAVGQFYDQLLEFLSRKVTFNRVILPNFGTRPSDARFRSLARTSTIDCWTDFKNLGYNHGDWLLGGQSWGMCTHERPLGLVPAMKLGVEVQIFSHPALMLTALDDLKPVTDQDFKNDTNIVWQRQPDGFWMAKSLHR